MTVVQDRTVPSILVQVGTPPPPPPRPPLPIESLEYLWYSQTGVGGIRDDRSTALMNMITSKKNTGLAYVKEYTKNNIWASYFSSNYVPGGSNPEPEWVYGPDPADNNYSVGQLPGATLSLKGYKIAHEVYDGFPSGVYIPATKSVISTPMYCPDPGKNHNALLSYAGGGVYNPYHWDVVEENVSLAAVEAALLAGLGRVPLLNARPDGVIQVTPQSRTASKPNVLQLNVTQLEGTFSTKPDPGLIPEGNNFDDLEGNDDLNAFSFTLGIQPGCEDKSNEKLPWSIKFEFGEVTFLIEEGKPNATVRFTGQEPEDCPLIPSISQTTRHHMGERPYEIAFIPVYNGLLIGFGPPQSNTWAQQTLYFTKDKTKTAFQEVARILDLWTDTQEGKGKGPKTGSPDPEPGSPPAPPPPPPPLPPTVKAPVKRVPRILPIMPLGKNINPVEMEPPGSPGLPPASSPGSPPSPPPPSPPSNQPSHINKGVLCLSENTTKVEMGKFVRVSYHRCGGVIQFRPLVFPACWRSLTLMKGTSQDSEKPPKWENLDDVGAKKPKKPKPDPTKEIEKPPSIPVKHLEQVEKYRILPVVSYTKQFEYYAAMKKIPGNDSSPVWALVTEYRKFRKVKGNTKIQRDLFYRRPIESWGAFIYHLDTQDQSSKLGIKFKNQDGFLSVNDVPEERVRSVQINRSLDGCSGSISWDRYDPITGLVDRPPHNVGALRIGVSGGVDTVSGVVFTGVGVGNTESNTVNDNTITVPIFGREYKIQDQGGIKLIETPYFDGFDIREVMQYLSDYAGVPFLNLVKEKLRLPSGMFYAPLVDLRTGTPVWDGMVEAAKMVNCIPYFDRLGTLRLIEAAKTTGINWNYPATKVTSYQDTPDYSVVANAIVMQALVSNPNSYQKLMRQSSSFGATSNELPDISEPVFIIINLVTDPEFDWSKMAFYPFSGVFKDIDEFKRAAKIFAGAVSRYRSSGSIEIPGNAEIELLDTFNNDYVVTSVAHNIDTQQKTFRTNLTVERLTSVNPRPIGELLVLPVI